MAVEGHDLDSGGAGLDLAGDVQSPLDGSHADEKELGGEARMRRTRSGSAGSR